MQIAVHNIYDELQSNKRCVGKWNAAGSHETSKHAVPKEVYRFIAFNSNMTKVSQCQQHILALDQRMIHAHVEQARAEGLWNL